MKEKVTKFDLNDAFKALDDIEIPETKSGRFTPNKINLRESLKRVDKTDLLLEDFYDVNDEADLEQAQEDREAEVAKAKMARIEKIVDLDAETPDDILPSYVGKVIVQCPQCMTLFYKNPEDIEVSEDDDSIVNVNEVCQHCGNDSGYNIIGKVAEADPTEEMEEEPVEETDELDMEETEETTDETDSEETEEEPSEDDLDLDLNLDDTEEEEEEETKEEALSIKNNTILKEALSVANLKSDLEKEKVEIGNFADTAGRGNAAFEDGGYYAGTLVEVEKENDKYYVYYTDISNDGGFANTVEDPLEFSSFDKLLAHLNSLNFTNTNYNLKEEVTEDMSDFMELKKSFENEPDVSETEVEEILATDESLKESKLSEKARIKALKESLSDSFDRFEMQQFLEDNLGKEETLEAVIRAMSNDQMKEIFDYIVRMYDLEDPEESDELEEVDYDEVSEDLVNLEKEPEFEQEEESVLNDVDEIKEEALEECITGALKKVYENVNSFKTTSCSLDAHSNLIIEGNINFNSGNSKHTAYTFNRALQNNNKLILSGLNESLSNTGIFKLGCIIDNKTKTATPIKMAYKYTIDESLVQGEFVRKQK